MVNAGVRSLYNDSHFSDITIRFGNHEVVAHKCILSGKSEYFYTAFTGSFSVAHAEEFDLGEDETPEAIYAMLHHIYDLDYDEFIDRQDSSNPVPTKNTNLIFHINVFMVADKYDVPSLRALVVKNFKSLIETRWESEDFILAIKALCCRGAPDLADTSIQAAAATFCASKISYLAKRPAFRTLLEEEPFAGRLLIGTIDKVAVEPIYCCQSCRSLFLAAMSDTIARTPSCPGCEFGGHYTGSWYTMEIPIIID